MSRAAHVTFSMSVRMAAVCPPGGSVMGKMTAVTGLMNLNAQVHKSSQYTVSHSASVNLVCRVLTKENA